MMRPDRTRCLARPASRPTPRRAARRAARTARRTPALRATRDSDPSRTGEVAPMPFRDDLRFAVDDSDGGLVVDG